MELHSAILYSVWSDLYQGLFNLVYFGLVYWKARIGSQLEKLW